jgi:hypothetical protein
MTASAAPEVVPSANGEARPPLAAKVADASSLWSWWLSEGVEADHRAGQHRQRVEPFRVSLVADPQPPEAAQPGPGVELTRFPGHPDSWRQGRPREVRDGTHLPGRHRRDAVALVRSSDKTVTQVARELGLNRETLRQWVKQNRIDQGELEGLTSARSGILVRARA